MRYASNVDGNHSAIGKALRKVTVVKDMRQHGGVGYDFLARHLKTWAPVFIEVKDPSKIPSARKLTESEAWMSAVFTQNFALVLTEEDALRAVGVDEMCPKCRGPLRNLSGVAFSPKAMGREGVCYRWNTDMFSCVRSAR